MHGDERIKIKIVMAKIKDWMERHPGEKMGKTNIEEIRKVFDVKVKPKKSLLSNLRESIDLRPMDLLGK